MLEILDFWISEVGELYYLNILGVDQLSGYRAADLCLCFSISTMQLNIHVHNELEFMYVQSLN